ncbi:ERCC4 domain-containing protein [Thiohalorhabdus sp. Cl-TMA]|uniref:ERCC4 domain-containing protein n=1 Tax=Thiohalorhabdus methylotrophus TaxID=3242694 RepID=A0ABV4TVX6_9GAMM
MSRNNLWHLEHLENSSFPYRITVEQEGRLAIALRTKEPWPEPQAAVFCLREEEPPPEEYRKVEECVPVASFRPRGKKISVTLERAERRHCEFLFVTKRYKSKEGEYEQIFFRVPETVHAHRTKGRTGLFAGTPLELVVDADERRPWRFQGADIRREPLEAGTYALVRDGRFRALVARKTFTGFLGELDDLEALHEQLDRLAAVPHSAVVVEAQYGDFLDPRRVDPWPAARVARALAGISARHPALPVIYAGNRKMANEWAHGLFCAVAGGGRSSGS